MKRDILQMQFNQAQKEYLRAGAGMKLSIYERLENGDKRSMSALCETTKNIAWFAFTASKGFFDLLE